MLVAVVSAKGSPGVTTLAVALAAVWPDGNAVVVEADCAGGDLGGRCWLPDSPGLASLATGLRSRSAKLDDHVTRLPCGVDAVLAPGARHPATIATGLLAASETAWTANRPVVVDLGRLEPGTPASGLVDAASTVLLCTRGDAASLMHLAGTHLDAEKTEVVIVGASPYEPDEIAATVGLRATANLPWDPRADDVIWGRRSPTRGWTRRGFPAATRTLAQNLTRRADTSTPGVPSEPSDEPRPSPVGSRT